MSDDTQTAIRYRGSAACMRGTVIVVTILGLLAGCMSMPGPPNQSLFLAFFIPGTARLAPDAEQIVRHAAMIAASSNTSKIEVAVPVVDTPAGIALREGRFTAI